MLKKYNLKQDIVILFCDNMSVINILKKLVQDTRTRHIDIHHRFIRDLVEEKVVNLEHIANDQQLVYIFTKPLDFSYFERLRNSLGVCICEIL